MKNYYNSSLEDILNKYITKFKYGSFQPIIKDIFLRRAYEFDFSNAEIEKEVQNFVKNVKEIKYGVFKNKDIMGGYHRKKRKIYLNEEYLDDYWKYLTEKSQNRQQDNNIIKKKFGQNIYYMLTHESYHAISYDKEHMGIAYIDSKGKWKDEYINEIVTETGTARTSKNVKNTDMECYRRKTFGYESIAFAFNMLAASLGISEKELLKVGLRNREELMEVIASKFPTNLKEYSKQLFQKFTTNIDIICNILYEKHDKKNTKIEKELFSKTLIELYESSYQIMAEQIANANCELSPEYISQLIYRFSKIRRIKEDSLNHIEKKFYHKYKFYPDELKDKCFNNNSKMQNNVLFRIAALSELENNKNKINDFRSFSNLMQLAKEGRALDEIDEFRKHNINVIDNLSILANANNSYQKYIWEEDFDNGENWDDKIYILTCDAFENSKKNMFKKVTKAIQDIFSRFQNREQLELDMTQETCKMLEQPKTIGQKERLQRYKWEQKPKTMNQEIIRNMETEKNGQIQSTEHDEK